MRSDDSRSTLKRSFVLLFTLLLIVVLSLFANVTVLTIADTDTYIEPRQDIVTTPEGQHQDSTALEAIRGVERRRIGTREYDVQKQAVYTAPKVPPTTDNDLKPLYTRSDDALLSVLSEVTIESCGILDTADATYKLNESVSSMGTCFEITATNITLDCQGNTITFGTTLEQSFGVYSNKSATTIKHCVINQTNVTSSSGAGVYGFNASGLTLLNTTVLTIANYTDAVVLNQSSRAALENNTVTTQGYAARGVVFTNGSDDTVVANTFVTTSQAYATGMFVDAIQNMTLTNATIRTLLGNAHAIHLDATDTIDIINTTLNASGSDAHALYIVESNHTTVLGMVAYSYGFSGNTIALIDSHETVFNEITLSVHGIYGAGYYSTDTSSQNTFSQGVITAYGTDRYGFFLSSDENTTITDTSIITNGNYGYGILLYESDRNTFQNITITTSGAEASGLFLDSISSENNFSYLFITTNNSGSYPVHVWFHENNFSIEHSTFTATATNVFDVNFDVFNIPGGHGFYNFTNVTFATDYWDPNVLGLLSVYEYVLLNIQNGVEAPLSNVSVTVKNASLAVLTNTTSNEEGFAQGGPFLSYQKTSSHDITLTDPYLVMLSYAGTNETRNLTLLNSSIFTWIYGPESSTATSSQGGSSGGGGSSSGSSTCTDAWNCSAWSVCVAGVSTRICEPRGVLCTDAKKPSLERACSLHARNILFDIIVELLETSIQQGSELSAKLSLLNIGAPGAVNASLTYIIRDNTDTVVYTEAEVQVVETQKEFIKTFKLGNLPLGTYTLFVNLTYDGQTEPAISEARFSIAKDISVHYWWYTGGIVLVLLTAWIMQRQIQKKNRGKERTHMTFEKNDIASLEAAKKILERLRRDKDAGDLTSFERSHKDLQRCYRTLSTEHKKEILQRLQELRNPS